MPDSAVPSGSTVDVENDAALDEPGWNTAGIQRHLAALDAMHRDLMGLVHRSSGLPGRRPEAMGTTHSNSSSARHVFIHDFQGCYSSSTISRATESAIVLFHVIWQQRWVIC